MTADVRGVFTSAAQAFAGLVRQIPDSGWAAPGLGEWSVRDLVGHTSRSLITVSTYLKTSAAREDVTNAVGYYVAIRDHTATMGTADIVERGRRAGRDLGDDPAATIDDLLAGALADIDAVAGDPLIVVIGGMGMRLDAYLPTRTFELVVHSLDIARAVGVDHTPTADALADAAALAARIGVALGRGPTVLLALTGRSALPGEFSVV